MIPGMDDEWVSLILHWHTWYPKLLNNNRSCGHCDAKTKPMLSVHMSPILQKYPRKITH